MVNLFWQRGSRGAVAVMFFNLGFGYANWLARIPAVRERLGLDDAQLGLLLLCPGVGALVAFRMATAAIRRYGTRHIATLGSAMFGALLVVPALASNGLSAALGLFVAGWFNGLLDVALNAQAVEAERVAKKPILAALHGCFSLGGLGGALAGAAAAACDVGPALHLGGMGAVLFVGSALAGRALLEDEVRDGEVQALPARLPLQLLLLGAVALCSAVGEGAMAEWTAIYLRDELHTSMALAAGGYAAFSLAMVTGRLLGDDFSAKVAPPRMLIGCGLVAATSLALGMLAHTPTPFVLAILGMGAGLSLVVPVVLRAAARLEEVAAPRALSVLATLSYSGYLLGPPVIGLISDRYGLRAAMSLVVGACLLLAGLATRLRRPLLAG